MRIRKTVVAGVLLAAALIGTAAAQEMQLDGRTELKRADLAGVEGTEISQAILEVQPGKTIPRHIHYGDEISYVLQGTMVQAPGKDPVMLETGTSLHFPRETPHGGQKIVGDNALRLLTVHIVDKGKPFMAEVK